MGKKRSEEKEVKTRRFKVTFVMEVPEDKLAELSEVAVGNIVMENAEARWDEGAHANRDFVEDSYGFEVEEIE